MMMIMSVFKDGIKDGGSFASQVVNFRQFVNCFVTAFVRLFRETNVCASFRSMDFQTRVNLWCKRTDELCCRIRAYSVTGTVTKSVYPQGAVNMIGRIGHRSNRQSKSFPGVLSLSVFLTSAVTVFLLTLPAPLFPGLALFPIVYLHPNSFSLFREFELSLLKSSE